MRAVYLQENTELFFRHVRENARYISINFDIN